MRHRTMRVGQPNTLGARAPKTILWGCLLGACVQGPGLNPDVSQDLLGLGPSHPFPNSGLMTNGYVDIDPMDFDVGETDLEVARLKGRRGFSPVQTSVLCWPALRVEGLPSGDTPPDEGSVGLIDLTDGRWLRRMAELDQTPNLIEPCLLIRPLEAVPDGHQVGVVVRTTVMDRPSSFAALMKPYFGLGSVSRDVPVLLASLAAHGVPTEEVALAWQYPVDSGRDSLESALDWTRPREWSLDVLRDVEQGSVVPPSTWKAAEGHFMVPDVLDESGGLRVDEEGNVLADGEHSAHLYVHVPASVRGAQPGTVPVMIFGHGIFGSPSLYLDDPDDPSRVIALAEQAEMVVVATSWTGLSFEDRGGLPNIALDPARIHEIPDKLIQAQLNVSTLIANLQDGNLESAAIFEDETGQSLIDPEALYYYGISLGAIEGAVLLAQDAPLRATVLHVGGSMWSTMLERSFHWSLFEPFVAASMPDPASRQRLYALSQMYWDPVDPAAWTDKLRDRSFLLQVSIGDEQVPNMTSEVLARSSGLILLEPSVTVSPGIQTQEGPLPPGSSAMVQFDPQVPLPPQGNRPAPMTGAHEAPRQWEGALQQVLDHFELGFEGQVIHHCGAEACSASNQGA